MSTFQEQNEAMLKNLWAEGEKLTTHKGTTIKDLDLLVERITGVNPATQRPSASDWDRFTRGEGAPDEYDHDKEAENEN